MSDLAGLLSIAADNTVSEVSLSPNSLAVLLYALGKVYEWQVWTDYRGEIIPEADIETIHDLVDEASYEVMQQIVYKYPQSFFIHPFQSRPFVGNTLVLVNLSNLFNAMSASVTPVAVNSAMSFPFFARSGIYSCSISGQKSTSYGISTVGITGQSPDATLDWYNATAQVNQIQTFNLTVPDDGFQAIGAVMATKNASSSNYDFKINGIWGIRTGDLT